MDKESAHGAGDCRFESCRGHFCNQTVAALYVIEFSWLALMLLDGRRSPDRRRAVAPCTGHGINDRAGARCRRGGFAACSTPLFTTREKYARITSRATFARAAAHRHLRFCDKGSVANHARQNRQVRLPKKLNRVAQCDAKMCAQRKPTLQFKGPRGLEPPTLRLLAVRSNQLSHETDAHQTEPRRGRWPRQHLEQHGDEQRTAR